jgi:gentisate 1,2-dioxygenase
LEKQGFNYNFIGRFDISKVKEEVISFQDQWEKDVSRQKKYKEHKDTKTYMLQDVPLTWSKGQTLNPVKKYENDYEWEILSDIFTGLNNKYSGSIARVMYINLPSGKNVPYHKDSGYYLYNVRRFHIPILTNNLVYYTVGDEKKVMREGECWEINNNSYHSVSNNGDSDRVHLVIDIIPDESM